MVKTDDFWSWGWVLGGAKKDVWHRGLNRVGKGRILGMGWGCRRMRPRFLRLTAVLES